MTKSRMSVELPQEVQAFGREHQVSFVALKAFFRICHDWECTDEEVCRLFGGIGLIELGRLKRETAPVLPQKTLLRIRALVMIYKALAVRCGNIRAASKEMRVSQPGSPFFGKQPIAFMIREGLPGVLETCRALTGVVPKQANGLAMK